MDKDLIKEVVKEMIRNGEIKIQLYDNYRGFSDNRDCYIYICVDNGEAHDLYGEMDNNAIYQDTISIYNQ